MELTDNFSSDESDFVKHVRATHCKGCMNEGFCKKATYALDCYVRSLLPKGEYSKAAGHDCVVEQVDAISKEVNSKILDSLKKAMQ